MVSAVFAQLHAALSRMFRSMERAFPTVLWYTSFTRMALLKSTSISFLTFLVFGSRPSSRGEASAVATAPERPAERTVERFLSVPSTCLSSPAAAAVGAAFAAGEASLLAATAVPSRASAPPAWCSSYRDQQRSSVSWLLYSM
jgi:hypothetical protein